MRSLFIWLIHSWEVSNNSTVGGSSTRLATVVCVSLNSVSFSFTWSAINDTFSYHGWTVFKYLASWSCSFYSSVCSILFSPIFNMCCNGGMSFITVVTSSNSFLFFYSASRTTIKSSISSIATHVELVLSNKFWVSWRKNAIVAIEAFNSLVLSSHWSGGVASPWASCCKLYTLHPSFQLSFPGP